MVWDSEGRASAEPGGCGPGISPQVTLSVQRHMGVQIGILGCKLTHLYSSSELTYVHDGTELSQGCNGGPRVGRAIVHKSLVSLHFLRCLTPLATLRGKLCVILKPSLLTDRITKLQKDMSQPEKGGGHHLPSDPYYLRPRCLSLWGLSFALLCSVWFETGTSHCSLK